MFLDETCSHLLEASDSDRLVFETEEIIFSIFFLYCLLTVVRTDNTRPFGTQTTEWTQFKSCTEGMKWIENAKRLKKIYKSKQK